MQLHHSQLLQKPRSQEEIPCTRTQEISRETLLNKGRKPSNPLLYSQEKDFPHHRPSTQKGALQNQEASAQ